MEWKKKCTNLKCLKNRHFSNKFIKARRFVIFWLFLSPYFFCFSQNLIINPNPQPIVNFSLNTLLNSSTRPFENSRDSNWGEPWKQLSNCWYTYIYRDTSNNRGYFEINISDLDESIIQGEFCIPINKVQSKCVFSCLPRNLSQFKSFKFLFVTSANPIRQKPTSFKKNQIIEIKKRDIMDSTFSFQFLPNDSSKYFAFFPLRSNINYIYINNFCIFNHLQKCGNGMLNDTLNIFINNFAELKSPDLITRKIMELPYYQNTVLQINILTANTFELLSKSDKSKIINKIETLYPNIFSDILFKFGKSNK